MKNKRVSIIYILILLGFAIFQAARLSSIDVHFVIENLNYSLLSYVMLILTTPLLIIFVIFLPTFFTIKISYFIYFDYVCVLPKVYERYYEVRMYVSINKRIKQSSLQVFRC